jgi:hypothetical protein
MRSRILTAGLLIGSLLASVPGAGAAPQVFVVRDSIGHAWSNEMVHFDYDFFAGSKALMLTDASGQPVLSQFDGVSNSLFKARGRVWTVVTIPPEGQAEFRLTQGTPPSAPESDLSLATTATGWILKNEHLSLTIPKWTTGIQPWDLTALPAPLAAVGRPDGNPLAEGLWFCDGTARTVRAASSAVIEEGPVRITIRQNLIFSDGRCYQMEISLGARQDAARVTEATDVDEAGTGFRLSFQNGLEADHLFWNNQWKETAHAKSYALTDTLLSFQQTNRVCRLRPWSFWWLGDITVWAGFYRQGGEPFVGLIMLKPSLWAPVGWDGFDRTEVPLMERPGGRIEADFRFSARSRPAPALVEPMRRDWAVTVGSVADHVMTNAPVVKLRRQLAKYSEFPLDEVKDYGFEFKPARTGSAHPFLILSSNDVARVRLQAADVPAVRDRVNENARYILQACGSERTLTNEGWQAYYTKNYIANGQSEKLPETFLGNSDPLFGKFMAAAVKGMTRDLYDTFLEAPTRPAIGAYGPWFSVQIMRLLLNYDLIAGAGFLTPEEEARTRNALVFAAQVLAHPDYWNTDVGLCSANPNMTSSIRLPLGLTALFLNGHPKSGAWLVEAEEELKRELKEWISPGGAWVENPGYQSASLDGLFLLAQAIRNVKGRDYFKDANFKATMEYYGFILTPLDRRFPPGQTNTLDGVVRPPMVQPSIGDMFSGYSTCYNGWMAAATAKADPAYSARQQFFWKAQNGYLGMGGRASGFTPALTDVDHPAAPPSQRSRAFPGFGNILRTSWTDPRASYVAHRTGPNQHHYHNDFNSIVYYAKGAPLCTDFGSCYQPYLREAWYHNRVSLTNAAPDIGSKASNRDFVSLPATVDYSYGLSDGQDVDHRHVLLVKSADPLGANYVVIRDVTPCANPGLPLYWNLWCLSKEPTVTGNQVHFPGQFDVDLDVHVLSPANPVIAKDHFAWKQHIYVWGPFEEEQHGMRIRKTGPAEDFLTVLYPRATGQAQADITSLADGKAVQVKHMEGADVILLSPGKTASVEAADVKLEGEIAFARRYSQGALRLALVTTNSTLASAGGWTLKGTGPVAVDIRDGGVTCEAGGPKRKITLTAPAGATESAISINGKPVSVTWKNHVAVIRIP